MDLLFNGLWILNSTGQIIFKDTAEKDLEFIEKCFSAVEIIAKEIKEDFSVGTIALENKSLCMMKIPLKKTRLYLVGILNSSTIGQENKMLSTLHKISKIILKTDADFNSLTEESSLILFDTMDSEIKSILNQKLASFLAT
jgi:hypothetical protein